MTARPNALRPKPDYCLHRAVKPVQADESNLVTLYESLLGARGVTYSAIDCKGWSTVQCVAIMEGGTTPTIDVVPLEQVLGDNMFPDHSSENDEGFVVLANAITGIANKGVFEVAIDQGKLFLRVDAISGSPTAVRLYVSGKGRAISITGQS